MSMPQLQNLGLSGVALLRRRRRRLLRRLQRRAARALDRVRRSSSRSAATTPCKGTRRRRSRGRSASRGRASAATCCSCGCGCCRTSTRAFEEAARTGAPILRPLLFDFPDDPVTYTADDEFLFGDALLVAPITRPGVEHRHVYLPAGTWVQWWTRRGDRRARRTSSPTRRSASPRSTRKANAPIPLWPARMHTGEAGRRGDAPRVRGAGRRGRHPLALRGRGRGLRRVVAGVADLRRARRW